MIGIFKRCPVFGIGSTDLLNCPMSLEEWSLCAWVHMFHMFKGVLEDTVCFSPV